LANFFVELGLDLGELDVGILGLREDGVERRAGLDDSWADILSNLVGSGGLVERVEGGARASEAESVVPHGHEGLEALLEGVLGLLEDVVSLFSLLVHVLG